jgi:hypothetical protein
MAVLDRMLIGTSWTRLKGSHHPTNAVIDNVSPKGPRFKIVTRRGNSEYIRPLWIELGVSWVPADNKTEKQFDLWALARVVERDRKMVEIPTVDLNPKIGIGLQPKPELVACTSVYHRPKLGLVEKSLSYTTRNDHIICLDCKEKRDRYNRTRFERQTAKLISEAEPVIAEYKATENGLEPVDQLPLWHITIIQPTVVTVRAKDFLEAAALVSHQGEIIKVERL